MFGSCAQFLFVLYVSFAQFLWLDFPHFLEGRREGRRRILRILLMKVPDFTAVRENGHEKEGGGREGIGCKAGSFGLSVDFAKE